MPRGTDHRSCQFVETASDNIWVDLSGEVVHKTHEKWFQYCGFNLSCCDLIDQWYYLARKYLVICDMRILDENRVDGTCTGCMYQGRCRSAFTCCCHPLSIPQDGYHWLCVCSSFHVQIRRNVKNMPGSGWTEDYLTRLPQVPYTPVTITKPYFKTTWVELCCTAVCLSMVMGHHCWVLSYIIKHGDYATHLVFITVHIIWNNPATNDPSINIRNNGSPLLSW